MKYKGKVKADTVDYPEDVAKLKGDELLIEYHKFKVPRSHQVVITRWRLRAGDWISPYTLNNLYYKLLSE